MAITYSTKITHLRGAPSYEDLTNVITEVEFEIVAVDGEYTHNSLGHIEVKLDKDNFKPFNDITEALVKSWVEAHPVYESHKNILKDFIDNLKVPMNVGMEKPWE